MFWLYFDFIRGLRCGFKWPDMDILNVYVTSYIERTLCIIHWRHYISVYLKRRKKKKRTNVNTKVSGNLHLHDWLSHKNMLYHSSYYVLSLVSLMCCLLSRATARYKRFTKTILPMIKLIQTMVSINYVLIIFWWRMFYYSTSRVLWGVDWWVYFLAVWQVYM
jgi:hypothetical protein